MYFFLIHFYLLRNNEDKNRHYNNANQTFDFQGLEPCQIKRMGEGETWK